jgi:DNA polymerase-3 subunit gamma/tau
MPLYLEYRPDSLSQLIGNDSVKARLETAFARKKDVRRTFLLVGDTGCGKTTLARIIKNMAKCDDRDFQEYNTANTRGIDTIRDISQDVVYSPMYGSSKVYLLDECHKLTNDAQNALLKLTEEPPSHTFFILATTNEEKLIKTLKSGRLDVLRLERLITPQLVELINRVLEGEKVNGFPRKAIQAIAEAADGIPRMALSILDSVIDLADDAKLLQAIDDYVLAEYATIDLCRCVARTGTRWKECVKILEGLTHADPEDVRYAILGYLSAILRRSGDPRIAQIMDFFFESFWNKGKAGLVHACWCACQV